MKSPFSSWFFTHTHRFLVEYRVPWIGWEPMTSKNCPSICLFSPSFSRNSSKYIARSISATNMMKILWYHHKKSKKSFLLRRRRSKNDFFDFLKITPFTWIIDFITILGSANVNNMIYSTNWCSKPTDDVPGGSVDHTESPWTQKITVILLNSSEDHTKMYKTGFITILAGFTGRSYREVVYFGLEFIRLWLICTKYINLLMNHTQHMYPSNPTIG